MLFAIGWTPCLGPTLGAIYAMAAPLTAQSGTVGRGLVLAVAYCVGLGLPFVLMAAAWEKAGRASAWLRRHQRAIQLVGGVLLLLVGVMLVTGLWETAMVWLQVPLVGPFRRARKMTSTDSTLPAGSVNHAMSGARLGPPCAMPLASVPKSGSV